MNTIIVEASEAWPVVAAGLGSALIVSWITLIVAKKQRKADGDRLDKQLTHDRDMRDLQFLRETLAPIAEHAIDWKAFTSLHFQLDQAEGRNFGEWREIIRPLLDQVGETAERLRRDRRVLVILLGPEAEVSKWLGEMASDGDALIHIARERVEAERTTPTIRAALDGLWMKFGFDQARFIEQANKAVQSGSDSD